jgi:transposase
MTTGHPIPYDTAPRTWVAIDVAKDAHEVLVAYDDRHERGRLENSLDAIQRFVAHLRDLPQPVRIALEPTGVYHRPLAYRLLQAGFDVCFVGSLTCARYREARYTSWDKNDRKDARVILEVLQQGLTMRYVEPLLAGWHDLQELSKTYWQVTLARTRIQHSLLTHYLPLYWPEVARYWRTSRSEAFVALLLAFPTPQHITRLSQQAFVEAAWSPAGRKVGKDAWLRGVYELAQRSLALPVPPESAAVETLRLRLQAFLDLSKQRAALERWADELLGSHPDYRLLQTIPGIGPVFALTILAEGGDLRRFGHHRQFLKFCGLDLAKAQSGQAKGKEQLSKRGNSRLRSAFWFAGRIAVRTHEHSVRDKFERYLTRDAGSPDRRRKAYTAIAAKMARIAYAVVKSGQPYRAYYEHDFPSGSTPVNAAVEALATS